MKYPHDKTWRLALAIASSLAIAGCELNDDDDNVAAAPRPEALSFVPGTAPRFNPVASDLPFNTDLIFAAAATSDGTANVGTATDPVRSALNNLDGFSTNAYFDIAFDGSLDPATVFGPGSLGQNVFLVALNTGAADALNPANINLGAPFLGPTDQPSYRVEVVSLDGGVNNNIRVVPTSPLRAKTKYLVFMTNSILDAGGDATTPSGSYNIIRAPDTNITASLLPVRGAIQGWEQLAAGFINFVSGGAISTVAARQSLTLTYTFTTTDPQTTLVAMGSARAAIVQQQVAAGVDAPTAIANANALDGMGLLPRPVARPLNVSAATAIDLNTLSGGALAANVGDLYTGYIKLPYYQFASSGAGDYAYLQNNWRPDLTLAGALGATVPADVDGTYNVTYRYPFAARQVTESVPLQVTLPDPAVVPTAFDSGGANCGQLRVALGGYPTVIYIHGITSDRASVIALAHSLSGQCVATVAIDLPVHGIPSSSALASVLNVENSGMIPFDVLYGADAPRERHFNVVSGPTGLPQAMNFDTPSAAIDRSGAWFINLGRLQNTRDNLRQGVMDMLNLNASLGAIAALDLDGDADPGTPVLDLDRVYVVGVSLGGIVGTVFTTVNETVIANDMAVGLTAAVNPIQGLVASVAGSQLTQILANSDTFAPVINAGLAAAGVNVGTANYERFLYAAQSTVDSGDPVAFAQRLGDLGVPVLLQQIVGGGDASGLGDSKVYVADKVVPNGAESAPLTGTSGLAELVGAVLTGPGVADVTAQNTLVNLTVGHHGSLLRPSEDGVTPATNGENVATAELQTQVVSFVLSSGATTAVGSAPGGSNTAAAFIEAPAP